MPRDQLNRAFTGAIILFGIGFLLAVDAVAFWPWIMAVIALAMLPVTIARGGIVAATLASLWLIALAVLIETDTLWPGVLILLAIPVIVRVVVNRAR